MQLRGAYTAFRRRVQAHCSQYGITSDQFVLLSVLAEAGGVTQTELAERSYSDPATITAMLRLLEKAALVQRESDPADGRAKKISLSPEGRQLQQDVYRTHAPLIRSLTKGFTADERRVVARWLRHVVQTNLYT